MLFLATIAVSVQLNLPGLKWNVVLYPISGRGSPYETFARLTKARLFLVNEVDRQEYCHCVRTMYEGCHEKDDIISDVSDRSIISKRNTEASSEDEENAVMSSADRKLNPSTFQTGKRKENPKG